VYNPDTKEIRYYPEAIKAFILDHPLDQNKYLVHACLEGPEDGVYYRGEAYIINNYIDVRLPQYVTAFNDDFTIIASYIGDNDNNIGICNVSRVVNGNFRIYGDRGLIHWHAFGKRRAIITEINKNDYNIKGNGPYMWI
jgi:hypothetical protein